MGFVGASDLVVAGESTKFVMAYTGVGLTPDGSSSWFLPRLVGLRRALELTLTNRVLSAAEALDWGLITQVVPDDELARPRRAAGRDSSRPGRAPRWRRRSDSCTPASRRRSRPPRPRGGGDLGRVRHAAEGIEGVAAFVEKRKPDLQPSS